jgi:monoamine oxidase
MSLATSRRDFVRLAAGAAAASVLPGVAPRTPGAAGPPRVLVLGAGLAGLQAALLLEQQGFVVSVLEGQARVGGRLLTLADLPGTPEAGGQILGRSYVRLRATAERVGVRLKTAAFGHGPKSGQCADCHVQGKVPDRTGGPGALVYRKGRLMREADWADAADDLSTEERSVAPTRLLASYLGRRNPLSDAAAWTRYEHAPLDALSLEAYLKQLGASPGALEIMDVAPNCPGLARASALWALRDSRRRMDALGGVPLDFPAGASAFAATLAAALRSPVETGRVVRAIRSTADRVAVRCADGTHHEAAFAIATLPLPALARLEIDPPLEPVQARAVREIGYTPITRVFCEVSSRCGTRRVPWPGSPSSSMGRTPSDSTRWRRTSATVSSRASSRACALRPRGPCVLGTACRGRRTRSRAAPIPGSRRARSSSCGRRSRGPTAASTSPGNTRP